jgi:hypothetical protein
MSRRPLQLAALLTAGFVATVSLGAVPGALGGPPKFQRVLGYARARSGAPRATIDAAGHRVVVTLAQVRVPRVLRLRGTCRRVAPAAGIAAVSYELRLDVAVRLAADRAGTYLLQPQGGRYDRPTRSLNALLVQRGIATVTRTHGRYRVALLRMQGAARRAGRGTWGCRRVHV